MVASADQGTQRFGHLMFPVPPRRRFDTDGIAAVVQAVEQANAQSNFEDLTTDTAVAQAQQTAAADPVVQVVLQENHLCAGDCNSSDDVTVNELLIMVNIALGNADISACAPGDTNHDGSITINEILAAVNKALNGCG